MSVPPPALTITLGRKAYRWPVRVILTGLTVGLAVSLSALSGPGARDPGDAGRTIAVYGGGGLLAALAGAAWALAIRRNRLVVTIGGEGLLLRRAGREATIPVGAVDAVGLAWPVADPVWTVWFDPEAAPGVDAVAEVDGKAAALFRGRSLPPGWLPAVRTAATELLGTDWRVVDDDGAEVAAPAEGALAKTDHILVDGAGRYLAERGGALLAVAGAGRRPVVLRAPPARTLLTFRMTSRPPGRVRVYGADGRLTGEIRGGDEPSFHTAGGMLLGTTRRTRGDCTITGVDGRRSASLRPATGADDGGLRLERSPSAPDPLRTLALALPMVLRIDRRT
ncbi:hypothetical protein ACN3XK_30125 [Actinomadura welshii]